MQRLLVGVFILLVAHPALACAITVTDTLKKTFQESDVVFIGRVTRFAVSAATLDVMESFKGPRGKQFVVSVLSNCDFDAFEVGKSYLVIARIDRGSIRANLGSHTTEVTPETRHVVDVVRARAPWWRSPVSRIAPLRFLAKVCGELRYRFANR